MFGDCLPLFGHRRMGLVEWLGSFTANGCGHQASVFVVKCEAEAEPVALLNVLQYNRKLKFFSEFLATKKHTGNSRINWKRGNCPFLDWHLIRIEFVLFRIFKRIIDELFIPFSRAYSKVWSFSVRIPISFHVVDKSTPFLAERSGLPHSCLQLEATYLANIN